MAVTSNLYPPIVDTFMPAFLINSTNINKNICRIYFSLSLFNIETQIKNVQVVVRNTATNLSALNTTLYPSEIMITSLEEDTDKEGDDKYYIEIKPADMLNNNFEIDQYYKVQLRFTSTDAIDPEIEEGEPQAIDGWLADNLLYFSEWSTGCLIRGISVPSLSIPEFDAFNTQIPSSIASIQVLGRLLFADENENETLKKYKITLYEGASIANKEYLLDSGDIYTSNYTDLNSINYTFNYSFEAGKNYIFSIEIETSNYYHELFYYSFSVIQGTVDPLGITLTVTGDEENGCVHLLLEKDSSYNGQVIIKRTDNKSDFTIWEELYKEGFNDVEFINFSWVDYTIESGVLYKYAIQGVDEDGLKSEMVIQNEPILLLFNYIYLDGEDKQLKISLNPQINSFKRTISESKTETIGSKYPFIKRNGYMNYAQFPISGLISSKMDLNDYFIVEGSLIQESSPSTSQSFEVGFPYSEYFITKEEVYGDYASYYSQYNQDKGISDYQDFIYEKFFRDAVLDFLYSDQAKLFRSPTEGNFLIKLTDINFSPNQTLGRNLWSFSGNAYEIDDCNIENLEKYNILKREGTPFIIENSSTVAEALTPIKQVIFLTVFPSEGQVGILYIYEDTLYVWDDSYLSGTGGFRVLSSILVLDVREEDINYSSNSSSATLSTSSNIGIPNSLYTDNEDLYTWNRDSEEYEKLDILRLDREV